jgi:hypothetical protein
LQQEDSEAGLRKKPLQPSIQMTISSCIFTILATGVQQKINPANFIFSFRGGSRMGAEQDDAPDATRALPIISWRLYRVDGGARLATPPAILQF